MDCRLLQAYWRLALWVLVYYNSVIKRVKQWCCTLILLPKSTLDANLTTTNRFFTNDDWQHERFENFESDQQYESNLESDVRFEIESNHEASQVPIVYIGKNLTTSLQLRWLLPEITLHSQYLAVTWHATDWHVGITVAWPVVPQKAACNVTMTACNGCVHDVSIS